MPMRNTLFIDRRDFWAAAALVALFCCLMIPAVGQAATATGKDTAAVLGVTMSPAVYDKKNGKEIGTLESVYDASPEPAQLLGRDGDWLRIRFEGKDAWVKAADALPVNEILQDRPYRTPLLCPDGLPASFAATAGGKRLTVTARRTASLNGGTGVITLADEDGNPLWTSVPGDGLIACSPGQAAWPMAAADLDGDGKLELLLTTGGNAVPALDMKLLRWTGTAMETVLPNFYVTQAGWEMSEIWAVSDSPFGGAENQPPVFRYVSELHPPYFDGSFSALVVQENGEKDATSRGVARFRLGRDGKSFVLQNWVVPLQ
jgi:hypothetical protein